jgi:hypothetical protein
MQLPSVLPLNVIPFLFPELGKAVRVHFATYPRNQHGAGYSGLPVWRLGSIWWKDVSNGSREQNMPSRNLGMWTLGSKVAMVSFLGMNSLSCIMYFGVALGSVDLAPASSWALPFNLEFALPVLLSDSI